MKQYIEPLRCWWPFADSDEDCWYCRLVTRVLAVFGYEPVDR